MATGTRDSSFSGKWTSRSHQKTGGSSTLTATDRNSLTLTVHVLEGKSERCRSQVLCFQGSVTRFSLKTGARAPSWRIRKKVNAKSDIRDALLVQRMKHWLLRGKYGPIDNCSKRRGRKNYLFLVRKHKTLAQQNHLRESDVYL